MINEENEAIKIAKELEALGGDNGLRTFSRAAAELRRLDFCNESKLKRIIKLKEILWEERHLTGDKK
jgi:hypothetical protein